MLDMVFVYSFLVESTRKTLVTKLPCHKTAFYTGKVKNIQNNIYSI